MLELIDTNITLFRWPFRRLPLDETAELVGLLRKNGVIQAWAGTYEGVFHRDLSSANERLTCECSERGQGVLVPFGAVNPALPDWEEDLRRCHEVFRMPGIRLHPNYHGYTLDRPEFAKLLKLATERKLLVQICMSLEDERQQHPVFRVPHVDAGPLAELIKATPGLRVQLVNAFRALPPLKAAPLASIGQVSFDIAMLEAVAGVERFAQQVPVERILFGSHAPLFIWQSARLKLEESELPAPHLAAIASENAKRLLRVE